MHRIINWIFSKDSLFIESNVYADPNLESMLYFVIMVNASGTSLTAGISVLFVR